MHYYGTRLSENISRREPEGYLLCLNVPVARTGMQEYLPEELGLTQKELNLIRLSNAGSTGACAPCGHSGMIPVYRPEEEVFSPETMASFEAVPVTNDHPAEGVDLDNIRRLQAGHAQNVRRGVGAESDLLLADLVITDERLIEAILGGKREISCGYTYELAEENGRYIQRRIRGNHIAVVDAGRAGSRVSIKDHKGERSTSTMKKSLTKLLARMAKDGDVETVAEFIEEMIEGEKETKAEAAAEAVAGIAEAAAGAVAEAVNEAHNGSAGAATPGEKEGGLDEDTIAGIIERLDRLIELLTNLPAGDEDPEKPDQEELGDEEVAEVVEEVIEAITNESSAGAFAEEITGENAVEEVAAIVESILEPEISLTLEENGEGDEDPDDPESNCGNDRLRAALSATAPKLAKMSHDQRRQAGKDIAAGVKKTRSKGANRSYQQERARRPQTDSSSAYNALGKRIMAARNVNYHK